MYVEYTFMSVPAPLLDDIDQGLHRLRAVLQRPGYRARIMADLPVSGGAATIRLLKCVGEFASEGDSTIGALADALAVEHSTASRAVASAVAAGLVAKVGNAEDGRRVSVVLTDAGREALRHTVERRRAVLRQVMAGWSEDRAALLTQLLSELMDGFDELEG